MRFYAAILAICLGSAVQAETNPADSARAAISELEQAAEALQQAQKSRDRVAALTRTVHAYESGLDAMRDGLRRATIREAAIRGVFEAERDRLSRLLGVLQSIEATPAPATLVHPDGPVGSARSGMILSDIAPALQREADILRNQLEEVAVLRALQESAVSVLEEGLAGAQVARTALSQAISDRVELPRRFVSDPAAMQALINSTETLEGFASGLLDVETIPGDIAAPVTDIAARKGDVPLPVLGRVLRRFQETDAAGISRPGLILATRPLSLVTAPTPSTVRYAGPLLDYDQVTILEPGEGILIVLAGMGQVFVEEGEVVGTGAPVGLMGGAVPESQAFLISIQRSGQTDHSETLYIEIRENGTPVDPAEWFAVNKE